MPVPAARRISPAAPARTSATCANGSPRRRLPATSTYDPRDDTLLACRRSRRWSSPTRTSPVFIAGAFEIAAAVYRERRRSTSAFKSGARRRLARARRVPVLRHRALLPHRLPASPRARLDPRARRRREKLERGATVADVGCGHGASTIVMAQAFPSSRFAASTITTPRSRRPRRGRRGAGVADRIDLRGRRGQGLPGRAASTWSASSTACTTWATRSARPAICATALATTAR